MSFPRAIRSLPVLVAAIGLMSQPAAAQSAAQPAAEQPAETGGHLSIQLNALDPVDDACRISFLIRNGHDRDIAQAVFETVLFDTEGRVDRLTLFDFGDLPASRPRVRQFLVPGLDCARLGRVLINGAETCTGEGVEAAACSDGLQLDSRTEAEIIG
ncbi:hypothetical protein OB2597_05430 [Pseudooceanicola batsensis HTCC2597]|uniref:Tat pathway signal protein n=1 Tax=Pseudooceanicola batsensis (strain ATCC BAA-863 / DSM 15984 / KCTC 12145 / HTCC2597) TaxID=252305 RepID=A3TSS1_PSEBH|nr:hypothetical protein [Pseudooceanicola batsensis]EAQ04698.1 hypothetical protein OB2597_05430 [Pseudooceanicola batsensis HTCC2597]